MNPNVFEEVKLVEECPSIAYKFSMDKVNQNMVDTLMISFSGKYKDGAAGRPDAGFMKGVVLTGIEVWDPLGVIVDLRELEYNSGDHINAVFAAVTKMNSAILVGSKNRRGLSTLEFGTHTRQDLVDDEFFFDDLEKVKQQVKKRD
jgi:hypothetical protein